MPLIFIPDVEAIPEIDLLYTRASVGKDEKFNEVIQDLHAKGHDINIYIYDKANNCRPTTPLLEAILSSNESSTRIMCDLIKQNYKKLGDILSFSSCHEFPITTALRIGHNDIITHLLNAGGSATANDRIGPPSSVAFTTIPMYSLIHYGRWESNNSTVDIQTTMQNYFKIKDRFDAKKRPVEIPAGEYIVHWDNSEILKRIFKKGGDPNIAPAGKLSVTELLEDIVQNATNPKLSFQSDYPEAQLSFHPQESDGNRLVFSQYIVNPFKQVSPIKIKVIMDLTKIRKLVAERNAEIERLQKDQELDNKHRTDEEVKKLNEEMQKLRSQLNEKSSEQYDYLCTVENEFGKTHAKLENTQVEMKKSKEVLQEEIKQNKELYSQDRKLINDNLGLDAEKNIRQFVAASKNADSYFHFVAQHFENLLDAWRILSTNTIERTRNTTTDKISSGLGSLADIIPAPFNTAFKIFSGLSAMKADKNEEERFKRICSLLPPSKSIKVYSREVAYIIVNCINDHLNRLSSGTLGNLSNENLLKLSQLTLGIMAHTAYKADLKLEPSLSAEARSQKLTNAVLSAVGSESLLIQLLEKVAKETSPPNSPSNPSKKAPPIPPKPVVFTMNLKKGEENLAASVENKKSFFGNAKEVVKDKLRGNAYQGHA